MVPPALRRKRPTPHNLSLGLLRPPPAAVIISRTSGGVALVRVCQVRVPRRCEVRPERRHLRCGLYLASSEFERIKEHERHLQLQT